MGEQWTPSSRIVVSSSSHCGMITMPTCFGWTPHTQSTSIRLAKLAKDSMLALAEGRVTSRVVCQLMLRRVFQTPPSLSPTSSMGTLEQLFRSPIASQFEQHLQFHNS